MLLLVSGATATLRQMPRAAGRLGHLLTPDNRNDPGAFWLPWAADNAAFSGFYTAAFTRMLDKIERCPGRPLWVACPDVVAQAAATLERFEEWEPRIRRRGLPVALVAQDGLEAIPERIPWSRFKALFIGGGTEWKLGQAAAGLIAEAQQRGKLVHIGRVNSMRRLKYALRCGADSVDGSGFSRFPSKRIPWAVSLISAHDIQPELF